MGEILSDNNSPGRSITELTAAITAAYIANNNVPLAELQRLIGSISKALSDEHHRASGPPPVLVPAVPVRKSVSDEHVICLEDGKRFRSLKEHLRVRHNLSADEYRTRWGLPQNYPMAAPSYSAERANLARLMGLGRKGTHSRKRPTVAPTIEIEKVSRK